MRGQVQNGLMALGCPSLRESDPSCGPGPALSLGSGCGPPAPVPRSGSQAHSRATLRKPRRPLLTQYPLLRSVPDPICLEVLVAWNF